MADVSTVLEKGTPSMSVLLGKEVSYVNQKGGSVGEGDAGAPESVEGGLDEAETAV